MKIRFDHSYRVSVILTTSGYGEAFERAYSSLLRQGAIGWELIILLRSPEPGGARAAPLRDMAVGNIKYVWADSELGPGAAKNLAVRHASGGVLCYLEDEDEFYPGFLDKVAGLDGDCFLAVFGRDEIIHHRNGKISYYSWDTSPHRHTIFMSEQHLPLGLVHDRAVWDRAGRFDEDLAGGENWDFVRRAARVGAEILFLPFRCGISHLSQQRCRRIAEPELTGRQRSSLTSRFALGGSMPGSGPGIPRRQRDLKVLFASPESVIDPESEAGLNVRDVLHMLSRHGISSRAICTSKTGRGSSAAVAQDLAGAQPGFESRTIRDGDRAFRSLHVVEQGTAIDIFETRSPDLGYYGRDEVSAFATWYDQHLADYRPDVLLAYASDPEADPIYELVVRLARRHDIPVAFILLATEPSDESAFTDVSCCFAGSEYQRRFLWERLGLSCQVLPPVVDRPKVLLDRREPTHIVIPDTTPDGGGMIAARIVEQMSCLRPEVRFLALEPPERPGWAELAIQGGVDLSKAGNWDVSAGTNDPKRLLARAKILLCPRLRGRVSSRTVIAAMINGIPILASGTGCYPELLEGTLATLDLPVGPLVADDPPSPEDVKHWLDALLRLLDDPDAYHRASSACSESAKRWHPDALAARYRRALSDLRPTSAPPIVPKLRVSELRDSGAEPNGPDGSRQFSVPKIIDSFNVIRFIGRGGMGIVYEASREAGPSIALKILPRHHRDSKSLQDQFRREARVASGLRHPNIVHAIEMGEHQGLPYYTMPLIAGSPFDHVLNGLRRLRRRGLGNRPYIGSGEGEVDGPMLMAERFLNGGSGREGSSANPYLANIVRLGSQVADALAYAHQEGVVHRDIAPSNLILDTRGDVSLSDFGLASRDGDDAADWVHMAGQSEYLAPERHRGVADQTSDVYSVAIILYQLLMLHALDHGFPSALESVILRALAGDPGDRYGSVAEFAAGLRGLDCRAALSGI